MAIDMPDSTPAPRGSDETVMPSDDFLCDSQNIVTANDLYAYHVLSSITADLESMDMTSDLQYHADVQAEMRWSFLDAQQQRFWHRQIEKYMARDMKPLDSSTYEDFCGRRNLLRGERGTTPGDEQDLPDLAATPFGFLGTKALESVEHALSKKQPTVTIRRSARLMEKAQNAETCDILRRAWINSRRQYEGDANELPPMEPKAAKNIESTPTQRVSKANGHIQLSATNGVEATSRLPPVVPPPYNGPAIRKLEAMSSNAVPEAKDSLFSSQTTNIQHGNV